MGWTGYVMLLGDTRNVHRLSIGNLKGRERSRELREDRRIILKQILKI
jgi:hypothetical protein